MSAMRCPADTQPFDTEFLPIDLACPPLPVRPDAGKLAPTRQPAGALP